MSANNRSHTVTYIVEKRVHRRKPRWYRVNDAGPQVGHEYISDGLTVTWASEVPLGTRASVKTVVVIVPPGTSGE